LSFRYTISLCFSLIPLYIPLFLSHSVILYPSVSLSFRYTISLCFSLIPLYIPLFLSHSVILYPSVFLNCLHTFFESIPHLLKTLNTNPKTTHTKPYISSAKCYF